MSEPWERQPGESSKAFQAFQTYLDLGPTRTLTEAARKLHKNRTTLGQWSARWRWQDRLSAYESELARKAFEAEAESRREMAQRHARIDALAGSKIVQRLVGDEAAGIKPIDVNTMTWADIRALLETTQKLERLARGESTETVDVRKVRDDAVRLAVQAGLDPVAALDEVEQILRLRGAE